MTLINQVLQLSIPEKLELMELLWESVANVHDLIELTPEQQEELDQRLDQYDRYPKMGEHWSQVKQEILGSL